MNTPTITLGTRLIVARESAGISVTDMATRLGVERHTITRYEHDKGHVPIAVLYSYQALCDVPMAWLRGEVALTQEVVVSRCIEQLALWEPYSMAAA